MLPSACDGVLSFRCPRCGYAASDDYEVIDSGAPATWRCGACTRAFSVLLVECEACGGEAVDVALHLNEHAPLHDIKCRDCGSPVVRDDSAVESSERL
jgi:transcription elongation factor Elf1